MSKILRNVMRQWKSREDFLDAVEVPDEAWVHGRRSDIELELPVLWALVRLLRPAVTVELGTRHGVSARTLAHACWQIRGRCYTVDAVNCMPYLVGTDITFVHATAEAAFDQRKTPDPDVLFVDVDPHDYAGTRRYLDTWVQRTREVAAFHDIVPARPEIQVADAVVDWVGTHPGWTWVELQGTYGLGLLWRP